MWSLAGVDEVTWKFQLQQWALAVLRVLVANLEESQAQDQVRGGRHASSCGGARPQDILIGAAT